jgi:putative restriction endonuclease
LTFTVAVDDAALSLSQTDADTQAKELYDRRAYVTALVKRRLHQRSFRERVLRAYQEQCAMCRLRHYPLLDAAHITPDSDPEGIAEVRNGIALCKLHHSAYDAFLLGITPDYEIRIRTDILEEEDGPMLQHGLKGFHGQRLFVPRSASTQPDRDLLAMRFERFTNVILPV